MKTLEELNISPAPWRQVANGYGTLDVLGSDDSLVVAYENPLDNNDQENRRLIAAAPELYAALFEMVEMYRDGGSYDYEQKVIKMAKAALAKAAGESEAEK